MANFHPFPSLRDGTKTVQAKDTIICFSHLRWNFVFQRPQHLLTRAAKEFDVWFFEEPVVDENCRSHLEMRQTPEGVTVFTPFLPSGLCHAECLLMLRRLLNMLVQSRGTPRIAWYYTPLALEFSAHLDFECVVYDCMDELSNFRGADSRLPKFEAELLAGADIVFTGGHALYEAKKSKHDNIHAFPSSIERAHFEKARMTKRFTDPFDQKHIPHPRIGFFGVIDERADLNLLRQVAEMRPDHHFVIVGPVVKIDQASLPQLPNIHWLGQKRYQELPAYLAHWDVGFMPFAINDSTRFISPTKTPEFLAAGLPVVSTPVPDVVRSWGKPGFVSIADTPVAMCKEIDRALVVDRSLWLKRIDQVLSSMSWDATFAAMRDLIEKKLSSRREGGETVANIRAGEAHV